MASSDGGQRNQSPQWVRYTSLALLYFVQGAPYGFQTACLPLLLRQTGLSFTSLGAMKLLFLPWVCKPLYAPLLERTRSRHWWLLASLSLLASCCLLASLTVGEEQLARLAAVLLLLNLASAAQDVCVDGLALTILLPSELGAGNTIQVVAYKCGAVVSGSLLLWCREVLGWTSMWLVFCLLYVLATAMVAVVLPAHKKEEREEEILPFSWNIILTDLREVLCVPGTPAMVVFVLFYKLAERGESLLPLHLVDKGVPLSSLALWTGAARSLASVLGSALAGYLVSGRGLSPVRILYYSSWARCLPLLVQLCVVHWWGPSPLGQDWSTSDSLLFTTAVASLCASALTAGLLTTSCFTLMMALSRAALPSLQSCHYSLLSTMEVAGKLAFASLSGGLIDTCGLEAVLVLLLLLAVLTPPLIPGRKVEAASDVTDWDKAS